MKRILVPIDFSQVAMNALDAAHSLAKKVGAEVMLLHVVEDSTAQSFNTMGIVDYDPAENLFLAKLMHRVKDQMDSLVGNPKYSDIVLRYKIEVGHPFGKISDVIAEENSSLIVMGSTGASGLAGILVGSNADKVVKFASCPVITIKEATDLTAIKSIVYATDMKEEQSQIIGELKAIQQFYGAHLHIVKSYNSEYILKKELEDRLEEFAKQQGFVDYSVTAVKEADEVDAILDFAEEIKADMIAMGTHRGKGLESLLSGFISKRVVNRTMKPIWTKAII